MAEDDPEEPAEEEDDGGDIPAPPTLPSDAYDIGWAGLTAEEQLMVELINRARLDPVAEQNLSGDVLARASNADPDQALAVLEPLADAARLHSEDMDDREFFSHSNPDGDGPTLRAEDEGYTDSWVGENISFIASGSTNFDRQGFVESHHTNLWGSDGHQNNMLGDNYNVIGVGYDYGDHNGFAGATFNTENFSNDGNTYLTGVVIDDADGDEFYDMGEGQGGVHVTAYDGDEAYATATWDAGGYTLALPPGSYRVVFEGGDLDMPYETDVTIGSENVKLDVIEENGALIASLNATPAPVLASSGEGMLAALSLDTSETEGIDDDPEADGFLALV